MEYLILASCGHKNSRDYTNKAKQNVCVLPGTYGTLRKLGSAGYSILFFVNIFHMRGGGGGALKR